MLLIVSPAKSLDFSAAAPDFARTMPEFAEDAAFLARAAAKLPPSELERLMGVSEKLAALNSARFKAFVADPDPDQGKQAALAFDGDVYKGLAAKELSPAALLWAQDHLRILSGLYGLLRPLDLIQPYRLEMGAGLKTRRGSDLYAFWGERLAAKAAAILAGHENKALINLASKEYARAVPQRALAGISVVSPIFLEEEGAKAGLISFFAKRARGLMARFVIEKRVDRPEGLKDFAAAGYRFDPGRSRGAEWAFSRPKPPPVGAARSRA